MTTRLNPEPTTAQERFSQIKKPVRTSDQPSERKNHRNAKSSSLDYQHFQYRSCPALVDTLLSTYPGLEGFRADIDERAVTPLTVIVGFDVFKHSRTHLVSRPEALAMDAFNLQAVEEALGTGIVVAVALGAHATPKFMRSNQVLVSR